MDEIAKKSESCDGVMVGDCTGQSVQCLLFTGDLVLLDSTQNGLQQSLGRFSDACSVAGMKISSTHVPDQTTKAVLSPNWCSTTKTLRESFKDLSASSTSDGRQNIQLHIRSGKASAVTNAPDLWY